MCATSKYRGHKIEFINDKWIFSDTKELVCENKNRPCGNCNKKNTKQGHDSCIADLPRVMNACCGHGKPSEAYIQFLDGRVIRGAKALNTANKMKNADCNLTTKLNHE